MTVVKMKKIITILVLSVGFVVSPFFVSTGFSGDNFLRKEGFLASRRILLTEKMLEKYPGSSKTRADLRGFAAGYSNGLDYIMQGQPLEALEELEKARRRWPEFYGTDILIALANEESGNVETAARYYKSYLLKLRNLIDGQYRISGSLMVAITGAKIESYEQAEAMVNKRYEAMGVDGKKVRPAFMIPGFVRYVVLVTVMAGIYMIMTAYVLPYYKKRDKILNPPEGFWTCKYCGKETPELSYACHECGRKREEGGSLSVIKKL